MVVSGNKKEEGILKDRTDKALQMAAKVLERTWSVTETFASLCTVEWCDVADILRAPSEALGRTGYKKKQHLDQSENYSGRSGERW